MQLSSLRRRRDAGSTAAPTPAPDPDLIAQRDRLVERYAVMQSELGGLFYEMAIRDHVRMNILIQKAAELQRVEAELAAIERELGAAAGGRAG